MKSLIALSEIFLRLLNVTVSIVLFIFLEGAVVYFDWSYWWFILFIPLSGTIAAGLYDLIDWELNKLFSDGKDII